MSRQMKVLALGAFVVLAGCGGGGDSPTQATAAAEATGQEASSATATAEGLWSGTTATNRTITGIVLSDGTYYFLYSFVGNPSLVAGVVQGTGMVSGTTFSSSNARDFNLEGLGVLPGTVSATVATRQSLSGTVSYGTGSTSFSTTYHSDYEATPSLAAIAGTFTGQVALSAGIQSASVSVSPSGVLSGGSGGCAIGGTMTPRSDGNAFNVVVTFGASPCYFAHQTFSGIAYYNSGARRLYAAAPNASRTDGVLFVGTKP
jgi:hypothetical protein